MGAQQPDGVPVQGDRAAAGRGLRRPHRHGVAGGDPLLGDGDAALVEVDVNPPQPGDLTPAQPAQRGQPPQRIQPVVADLLEEHGELTRGPHAHRRPFPVLSPGAALAARPAGPRCRRPARAGSRRSTPPAGSLGCRAGWPVSAAGRTGCRSPTARRTSPSPPGRSDQPAGSDPDAGSDAAPHARCRTAAWSAGSGCGSTASTAATAPPSRSRSCTPPATPPPVRRGLPPPLAVWGSRRAGPAPADQPTSAPSSGSTSCHAPASPAGGTPTPAGGPSARPGTHTA